MWNVSTVPLYLWCMLLLPSVAVAIYIAVRRRWIYAPILSFSLATVILSSAESVYTVFTLQQFDEKFRHAPNVALEISFFVDAVVGFTGLLFYGFTLAYFSRPGRHETRSGIVLAALLGGTYATLPNVLYWWHIQAPPILLWIWILMMPVMAALLAARQTIQTSTGRSLPLR